MKDSIDMLTNNNWGLRIIILIIVFVDGFIIFQKIEKGDIKAKEEIVNTKTFLIEHEDISFIIDDSPWVFNKYTPSEDFKYGCDYQSIMRININYGKFYEMKSWELKETNLIEIILSDNWQPIPNTNYEVACSPKGYRGILFKEINKKELTPQPTEEKKEIIKEELIKKPTKGEKNIMGLSFATWAIIGLMMLVIAKIAHKITLKTIFKPTKKVVNDIKNKWDKS